MENDFLLIFLRWPFHLAWGTNPGMVGYICDCTETALACKDKVWIILLSITNLDSELKLTWMSFRAKILLLITLDKVRNKCRTTNSNWVTYITGIIVHRLHINYKSFTALGRLSTNFLILQTSPQPLTATWCIHGISLHTWRSLMAISKVQATMFSGERQVNAKLLNRSTIPQIHITPLERKSLYIFLCPYVGPTSVSLVGPLMCSSSLAGSS